MIKINGQEIQLDLFPNCEVLVHTDILNTIKKDKENVHKIYFKWIKDDDLLHFYFVLKHLGKSVKKNITITYMPYSRMDRNQNGNCFTLKYVAELLNKCLGKNDTISVVEPHSDITNELLNSERINVITPLMNKILKEHPEIDMICYPDKGAKNRFQDDSVSLPVVFCNKVRDFDTGEIKGLELDGDVNVSGKNILILDDLSSKGGTFYHTANKLKQNGAKDVYLGVCHVETTIRHGAIYQDKDVDKTTPIKHIYCMNTMLSDVEGYWVQNGSNNLTMYDIDTFLDNGSFEEVK